MASTNSAWVELCSSTVSFRPATGVAGEGAAQWQPDGVQRAGGDVILVDAVGR
jgi:hypothetical protein